MGNGLVHKWFCMYFIPGSQVTGRPQPSQIVSYFVEKVNQTGSVPGIPDTVEGGGEVLS